MNVFLLSWLCGYPAGMSARKTARERLLFLVCSRVHFPGQKCPGLIEAFATIAYLSISDRKLRYNSIGLICRFQKKSMVSQRTPRSRFRGVKSGGN